MSIDLASLLTNSVIPGLVFGPLFAFLFPWLSRRLTRTPAGAHPYDNLPTAARIGIGLSAGGGFALLMLVDYLVRALSLPSSVYYLVLVLFGLVALGTAMMARSLGGRAAHPPG